MLCAYEDHNDVFFLLVILFATHSGLEDGCSVRLLLWAAMALLFLCEFRSINEFRSIKRHLCYLCLVAHRVFYSSVCLSPGPQGLAVRSRRLALRAR